MIRTRIPRPLLLLLNATVAEGFSLTALETSSPIVEAGEGQRERSLVKRKEKAKGGQMPVARIMRTTTTMTTMIEW
jgi:hypothetical protein